MDKLANQKEVFAIIAVLMLLSVASMIAVIPAILLDKSSGALPLQASSGALIGIGLHLIVAYWFGIKLRKRSSKVRNEVYILSAVGFFFLGFMILDGAYAFQEESQFIYRVMSICAIIDFAASIRMVIALFFLRKKKKA